MPGSRSSMCIPVPHAYEIPRPERPYEQDDAEEYRETATAIARYNTGIPTRFTLQRCVNGWLVSIANDRPVSVFQQFAQQSYVIATLAELPALVEGLMREEDA